VDVFSPTSVLDCQPSHVHFTFRDDVLGGLLRPVRQLPGKYLYDGRGSMLFDAVCAQPEYYLTRAEQQIIERHCQEMAAEIGERATLIEFGGGSGLKTWHLLKHLERPVAYLPVDTSRERLLRTADCLDRDFPDVEIQPVCADYTLKFELPPQHAVAARRVVYFPGSLIGSFEPTGAVRLLNRIARLCGPGGRLLIGIDLVKDAAVVERAYNDRAGVTAELNLNLLLRINRELGGEFDLAEFEHAAFYDRRFERMEIGLVSKIDQKVRVNGIPFGFRAGEPIHTQYAHKYTLDRFARLAGEAGLKLRRYWTDERQYFAVAYLANELCR
jgi:dimethylhistidine N-methyltransferase